MSLNWRNPGMEYLTGQDIYDYGFNNLTGLSSGGTWGAAALANLNGNNFQWQRPDTSQMENSASIQNYLSNESTARQVFGLLPGNNGSAGGAPTSSGSGSANSANSLQAQPVNQMPVNSQLSGYNFGATASAPAGTAPVVTGGSVAGGGGAAGASAGAGGGSGFWSGVKGALGNRQLMTGIITGLGAIYGQYDQKKQAKDAYNWQKGELEAQRAYQQQRLDAQRNSPLGQMIPSLMAAVAQLYQGRLAKRGVNLDLTALISNMMGGQ